MTKEELEQFRALAKKYTRGTDKEEVIKIISEDIHEVYQEVNDRGHGAATKSKQADIDDLSTKLTTEKTRAEDLDRQLKAIKEAPDIAAMREKYEADEKRLRNEHAQALQKQEGEFKGQLQVKEQALLDTRLDVAKRSLVAQLADSKIGVDQEYAHTVLVEKPEVKGRLKVDPDGTIKVLKKGSQDMYIVPAEGRTALEHLAEELAEGVEAKWKGSGTGRGSGTEGSVGGAGAGSTTQLFEDTRARVKEREKAQAASRASGSAHERLGSRR